MEAVEELVNQIADAEEGAMEEYQQTAAAASEDGRLTTGSDVDGQIANEKAFFDPKWVQSFKQRICDDEHEASEDAEHENQIADAEEVAMEEHQQTAAAASEDGRITTGSDVDGQIANGKAFFDPKWVQSFKQRICDDEHEASEDSSSIQSSPSTQINEKRAICRFPSCLREIDEKAIEPQRISIGPFHYTKRCTHLQVMEKHKRRYLNAIRTRLGKGCLERFLAEVKLLEHKARACYSEEIKLDSNSFVEMMVLDGCFIIELFCRAYDKDGDDPLLNSDESLREELATDLLKLENQIPFVILEHLFDLMNLSSPRLAKIAVSFFSSFQPNYKKPNLHFSYDHLLHLMQSSLLPFPYEVMEMGDAKMTHSASELQQAGIQIKKATADSFLNIKFQKEKAVIEIPPFIVQDNTIPILLNLIAMEQSCDSYFSCFTVYTAFMDCLISSPAEDVGFLCEKGIINNTLGSHKEVADLFNKIKSKINFRDNEFYLVNVFNDINRYYENRWHIRRAQFKRNLSLLSSSCSSRTFIPRFWLHVKK